MLQLVIHEKHHKYAHCNSIVDECLLLANNKAKKVEFNDWNITWVIKKINYSWSCDIGEKKNPEKYKYSMT